MKFFKSGGGEVFAFESDGSQDDIIPDDLVAITDQEADELRFPPPAIDDMRDAARVRIRAAYTASANAPVVASGITWDGGFDSAIKLDAARRLAESAGLSDVTFYSSDNLPHVLSFSAALQIVIAVAGAFQSALATKQTLMRAVDEAADADDLALVVWP